MHIGKSSYQGFKSSISQSAAHKGKGLGKVITVNPFQTSSTQSNSNHLQVNFKQLFKNLNSPSVSFQEKNYNELTAKVNDLQTAYSELKEDVNEKNNEIQRLSSMVISGNDALQNKDQQIEQLVNQMKETLSKFDQVLVVAGGKPQTEKAPEAKASATSFITKTWLKDKVATSVIATFVGQSLILCALLTAASIKKYFSEDNLSDEEFLDQAAIHGKPADEAAILGLEEKINDTLQEESKLLEPRSKSNDFDSSNLLPHDLLTESVSYESELMLLQKNGKAGEIRKIRENIVDDLVNISTKYSSDLKDLSSKLEKRKNTNKTSNDMITTYTNKVEELKKEYNQAIKENLNKFNSAVVSAGFTHSAAKNGQTLDHFRKIENKLSVEERKEVAKMKLEMITPHFTQSRKTLEEAETITK